MEIENARMAVGKVLDGVSAFIGTETDRGWDRNKLSPIDFPMPSLLLFALRDLHGLRRWGPGEKLLWGITADYQGTPFSVTFEKFGACIYFPTSTPPETRNEILDKLKSVAKIAEAHLRTIASVQIESGNVTIENMYVRLDNRYMFFRERAYDSFRSPRPKLKPLDKDNSGKVCSWIGSPCKPMIEGGYFAGAMIDSYFSRLEHLFVLVLPFLDFETYGNALVEFVGKTWGEKWKTIFNLAICQKAKMNYEQLREVKEAFRNPLAHGGFGKRGTSFFFHVEKVGALPALLSKKDVSPDISITPVPERSYRDICACFDATDMFLAEELGPGVEFAKTGLDIALSEDFRSRCKEAAESAESLQEFIALESYEFERHANMDF